MRVYNNKCRATTKGITLCSCSLHITKYNILSNKGNKSSFAYLESQSTSVFGDQEVGQIHEVRQRRIEQQ